jgi:NADPH:quinone reductase-like Zn-dependent oxidoreductase
LCRCSVDASGVVEEVGSAVTHVKKGDRVAAFSGFADGTPAFAEYLIAPEYGIIRIPDSLSYEAASTLPVGLETAAQGLFHHLKLPKLGSAPSNKFILIWGASGSVGAYAVQLSALAGFKVIATASPRNFDYVRSLGASFVFDHNAPDVVDQIKKAANNDLHYAFDTISAEAGALCVKALSTTSAAFFHTCTTLPQNIPGHVTASYALLATVGKDAEKSRLLQEWIAEFEPFLASGEVKTNNVEILPGGLNGIVGGFQRMVDNKVSAVKLVAVIADTK